MSWWILVIFFNSPKTDFLEKIPIGIIPYGISLQNHLGPEEPLQISFETLQFVEKGISVENAQLDLPSKLEIFITLIVYSFFRAVHGETIFSHLIPTASFKQFTPT